MLALFDLQDTNPELSRIKSSKTSLSKLRSVIRQEIELSEIGDEFLSAREEVIDVDTETAI